MSQHNLADRAHLREWQNLIGKTVQKQQRKGLLKLLTLVFDDYDLPLGNGFSGRDFTGDTLMDVVFHHNGDFVLTGDVLLKFGDNETKQIITLDQSLTDCILPEDYQKS